MFSMTGFGKGVYSEGGLTVTVELKSVNNRFLDVSIKLPHLINVYEESIRAQVREELSRGHVDVFVSVLDRREKAHSLYVDTAVVAAYVEAAKRLEAEFNVKDDLTATFLLKTPDVVRLEEPTEPDEEIGAALRFALKDALSALKEMREKEGERLKADLLSRMRVIDGLRAEISVRAPKVTEEYLKKLTERMQEYLSGKVDESRLLTEAALFADKCNIDEELTRLSSHIAEFGRICTEPTVGRKLDFLVQEFNRECNTVCSKSNDALITKLALDMKNEIEKVREQIQNLE